MLLRSLMNKIDVRIVHIIKDAAAAVMIDRCASIAKTSRKTMLMPISAGTMDTDSDAKSMPLLNAMNRNATTIV